MNPPVPGVEASRKVSGETHSALPVVLMTCSSETSASRSRSGSTRTWSWRSRWPQIGDVGHPGDARAAGAGSSSGRAPTSRSATALRGQPHDHHPAGRGKRLSICGGALTPSAARGASATFSAPPGGRGRAVPGSKIMTTRRQPGQPTPMDLVEQGHAVQQVLFQRDGDELLDLVRRSPRASVCTSTTRGELRQLVDRHVSKLDEAYDEHPRCRTAITSRRNFRLEAMTLRMIDEDLLAPAGPPPGVDP